MTQTVLLVTATSGAENCAAAIGRQLGVTVEVAENRRAAMVALRRREYAVMVLDESLVEADPTGAEVLWQQAGLAVPIQVNLGISGCNRVLREVRAALQRRERELSLAMRAAAQVMEGEMNTTITGLLLQTQLALDEPALPPATAVKLRQVVELAGVLRNQLRTPPEVAS
jgi:DNA-binding NtrC family response regulator